MATKCTKNTTIKSQVGKSHGWVPITYTVWWYAVHIHLRLRAAIRKQLFDYIYPINTNRKE